MVGDFSQVFSLIYGSKGSLKLTEVFQSIPKGAFNDYVDTILPFFDHHLPQRGHF